MYGALNSAQQIPTSVSIKGHKTPSSAISAIEASGFVALSLIIC